MSQNENASLEAKEPTSQAVETGDELNTDRSTPGPWKTRAVTFCADGIPSYEVVMPGEPHLSAVDARLIDAAPDYHLQAKLLITRHDQRARIINFDYCGCVDCTAFRPIIAKIKGGSGDTK